MSNFTLPRGENWISYYTNIISNPRYGFKKVSNPYLDKTKCVPNPDGEYDYLVKYNHKLRNTSRIYENVLPCSLPRTTRVKTYYTYILTRYGLVCGLILDSLELGTGHQMLVREEDDEVYIAGELELFENNLQFNFMSGTYSALLKLDTNPNLKGNLIQLLTALFTVCEQDVPLAISFTDKTLFPIKSPSIQEVEEFCSRFPNQLFTDPNEPRCVNDPSIKNAMTNPTGNICSNMKTHSVPVPRKIELDLVSSSSSKPSSLFDGDSDDDINEVEPDDEDFIKKPSALRFNDDDD